MGKKMKIVVVSLATIFLSYVLAMIIFMVVAINLMNNKVRIENLILKPRTSGRRRFSLSDFR
jgi:hypothetical protein